MILNRPHITTKQMVIKRQHNAHHKSISRYCKKRKKQLKAVTATNENIMVCPIP